MTSLKIERDLDLDTLIKIGKVTIIYGARRVGKTTIIEKYLEKNNTEKTSYLSGENFIEKTQFEKLSYEQLNNTYSENDILFIDEAQNIQNVGAQCKILIDNIPTIKIILTGSSAIDLLNRTGEPLVGRSYTYELYPSSVHELQHSGVDFHLNRNVENLILFGGYPEVFQLNNVKDKRDYLNEIVSSYLFKDVLNFGEIRNSKVIFDLVKLLAYQIGSTVSNNELAEQLMIDVKTVQKYLDILEKCYIVKSLPSYHLNLRNALKKKKKYYFNDLGVRNAIVNNFENVLDRNDKGAIVENFIFTELLKHNGYTRGFKEFFYYRNYNDAEVDFIAQKDGKIELYETKFMSTKSAKQTPLGKAEIITFATCKTFIEDLYEHGSEG